MPTKLPLMHLTLQGSDSCSFQWKIDYNPIQPGETQKAIYGNDATRVARDQWLQQAADVICSVHQPEAAQAYRHLVRSNGLHEELARAILCYVISVKLTPLSSLVI